VLFAPMAYVDVTSSWGFRSRWQRMHVAAAGMIAEFHIASLCAFWWLNTDSPVVAQFLFTVIFMASLTTVLFNANPLMRFDGYYLLADLVNIPNLASNGFQYLKGVVSRWFLGAPQREVGWQGTKGFIVRVYGVLAFFWRIVVCAGLLISASLLFHGAGVMLAGMGVLTWVCLPVGGAIRTWAQHANRNPLLVLRFLFSFGLLVGLGVFVWDVLPWPGARQAHGIIEYAPLSVVRAEVAGFVEEVCVEDRQTVAKGDLLLRLRNDDLETEFRELEIAIQQSEVKRRKHLNEEEIASAQVEQENRTALQKRLSELQKQRERLLVRAPQAGRVMARELPLLPETYLKEGDPILEIGDPENKELQIAISQPDIETYRSRLSQSVPIRLRIGTTIQGNLIKLDPRATQTCPHPALCAPVGGPLAVRSEQEEGQENEHQLVEPHLKGTVQLDARASTELEAGLIGGIALRDENDTFGRVAYRRVKQWLRDRRDLFEAEEER
ncbi:MAG: efflux RND transporter periplasmic adaptor subunit, partial [Planctomycetaceae bacterium]|nr:efflux RND transporter periplasmic adaptor subunit [Planctomycetaceae bacterium]